MDHEIRHHLEARAEWLVERGLAPDEARREAARRFGDLARVRAQVRAVDRRAAPVGALFAACDHALRDLRFALRSVRRAPWFATAVVGTLGLGMGANVAIFSVVEAVLLRPLPFPEADRVVYLGQLYLDQPDTRALASVSPANYLDWESKLESFESMAAVRAATVNVAGDEYPERLRGARVSADYFRVLDVQPVLGRTFSRDEDVHDGPKVVVVGHGFWSTHLASDPAAVGRTVRLDGEPHTVIGVMPDGLRAYQAPRDDTPIDLWRPYPFMRDAPTERAVRRLGAIGRLRDGVSLEQARAELTALAAALAVEYPEANDGVGATALPLPEAMRYWARTPILVLLGAVAFILLIACVNVGNLLLARADARRGGVTLRRALGAGRSRIVRELLTESLVLALAGAAVGVGVAWALLPLLVGSSPIDLTRMGRVQVNHVVLAFSALLAVLTAVLTGLVPALAVSAPDLVTELKERGLGRTETRRARAGKASLVVAEIAMSVVLVIGAALMLGTYLRLSTLELGFDPDDVVRVGALLPREQYAEPVGMGIHPETRNFTVWRPRPAEVALKEGVRQAMARLPGVESVGAGNFGPLPGFTWGSQLRVDGSPQPDGEQVDTWAGTRAVSPGWLETVRIPIVRGRSLEEADATGSEGVVVLDEEMAERLWPGQDPIGRSVMLRDGVEAVERPFRVVGIARSTRQAMFWGGAVQEGNIHAAYIPLRAQADAYVDWQISFRMRAVFLVRTERALPDIAPELRQVVASFDPDLPITIDALTDTVTGQYDFALRRFYMGMLVAFGALAILLVCSGVFAVMAYSVSRKTRELGIRLALGAHAVSLLRAELSLGLRLALVGLVIGGVGAAGLSRFIEGLLYGVNPVDPATYGAVAVLIVSVVVIAAYVPARRAAGIDPLESLRTD